MNINGAGADISKVPLESFSVGQLESYEARHLGYLQPLLVFNVSFWEAHSAVSRLVPLDLSPHH